MASGDENICTLTCNTDLGLLSGYTCSLLPCASVSKQVLVQNLSYENEFTLNENVPVGGTHFHMKGFAQRLVLSQRQKGTQKWPTCITITNSSYMYKQQCSSVF